VSDTVTLVTLPNILKFHKVYKNLTASVGVINNIGQTRLDVHNSGPVVAWTLIIVGKYI